MLNINFIFFHLFFILLLKIITILNKKITNYKNYKLLKKNKIQKNILTSPKYKKLNHIHFILLNILFIFKIIFLTFKKTFLIIINKL